MKFILDPFVQGFILGFAMHAMFTRAVSYAFDRRREKYVQEARDRLQDAVSRMRRPIGSDHGDIE